MVSELGSKPCTFSAGAFSFIEQLKLKHPALTANDLKVCAYLKVGLSNQEIAETINITPASMKKNLNRLKKKLRLTGEDDLREYMMGL